MTKRKLNARNVEFKPDLWLLLADMASFLDNPRETLVVVMLPRDMIADESPWEVRTFPLPPKDDALSCQVLAALVAMKVNEIAGIAQVFLATFSNKEPVRPYENLQFAVSGRVHEDDVHLAASFYVSDAGWGSYTCDHPECWGPRPLAELREGLANLRSLGD